jgi:transcription initiation factor TFIIB
MAETAKPRKDDGRKQAWDSKSPLSIAAAIIYIITMLSKDEKDRVPLSNIVLVTGVAEQTIKGTYRDLYPELVRLVPKYYADEAAIQQLPDPESNAGRSRD